MLNENSCDRLQGDLLVLSAGIQQLMCYTVKYTARYVLYNHKYSILCAIQSDTQHLMCYKIRYTAPYVL